MRGVGGSLVYFMRAGDEANVWNHEFMPIAAESETRDAGLLRVDYVAQTMQYEEMLSWLLYYLSLFEVSKTPQIEIADPLGLVYSQAVESPDRNFRMTLNSSAAAQTLSSRFLQGFMGAGVQHIALADERHIRTASRLRDYGLEIAADTAELLRRPAGAFWARRCAMTRSWHDFNILYDRDGEGEYFQLYSRAFAKRFFFEIVERRNYRSYGLANAPIRLAAQSRYRSDAPRAK